MNISFDSPELERLFNDLHAAPVKVMAGLAATTSKAALKVKTEAARNAPLRKGHARAYPKSITYTLETDSHSVSAEIGPDKDLPQGALGNLIEFGSVHNPAEPSLIPAWEAESEIYVGFVGLVGEQAIS